MSIIREIARTESGYQFIQGIMEGSERIDLPHVGPRWIKKERVIWHYRKGRKILKTYNFVKYTIFNPLGVSINIEIGQIEGDRLFPRYEQTFDARNQKRQISSFLKLDIV